MKSLNAIHLLKKFNGEKTISPDHPYADMIEWISELYGSLTDVIECLPQQLAKKKLSQTHPWLISPFPASAILQISSNTTNDTITPDTMIEVTTPEETPLYCHSLTEMLITATTILSVTCQQHQNHTSLTCIISNPQPGKIVFYINEPIHAAFEILNFILYPNTAVYCDNHAINNAKLAIPKCYQYSMELLLAFCNQPNLLCFFELTLPSSVKSADEISIQLMADKAFPLLSEIVDDNSFLLNCCPIINRFQYHAEPQRLIPNCHEYRLDITHEHNPSTIIIDRIIETAVIHNVSHQTLSQEHQYHFDGAHHFIQFPQTITFNEENHVLTALCLCQQSHIPQHDLGVLINPSLEGKLLSPLTPAINPPQQRNYEAILSHLHSLLLNMHDSPSMTKQLTQLISCYSWEPSGLTSELITAIQSAEVIIYYNVARYRINLKSEINGLALVFKAVIEAIFNWYHPLNQPISVEIYHAQS